MHSSLNADFHDEDIVLVTPPPILVKMNIVKPNTVWQLKKTIYGLRDAPRIWQEKGINSFEIYNFNTLITKLICIKAIYTQVCGSLLRTHSSYHIGWCPTGTSV